jgi:nucleotidyltransferase substrate binding protein (TIGR01987 family)
MTADPERLDLTPLINSHHRLAEGLARYESDTTDTQIRDGLVQRFEFTYEISQKTLKRYLESVSPSPGEYDAMPLAGIIRSANEQGLLLGVWSDWKLYREMRSRTSHTYNEEVALQVVSTIPKFLAEAAFLLQKLQERVAP